jgi:hypothetical protein
MATLRQAARANMKGFEPAPSTPATTAPRPSIPNPVNNPGRHPSMLASMPAMASTADAFTRQFYGGGNLPTHRILPVGKGGL